MGGTATPSLLTILARHWRTALAVLLAAPAAISAVLLLWPQAPPPVKVSTPAPRMTPSPIPTLAVHVVGAVPQPGLYELPQGARVADAVQQAGGLGEDADPASLNLAARLVDGQQIVVRPRAAPTTERPPALEGIQGGRINLNLASAAELDTLPGVGQALAQRIIERRQRLGPFSTVEQLRDERILPSATYERIKELVTVQ